MNLSVLAVGVISLFAGLILLIAEKTTPKKQRVPIGLLTYSHEHVRIQILVLLIFGTAFIITGLIF